LSPRKIRRTSLSMAFDMSDLTRPTFFPTGATVQHLKTKGVYTILETPESLRLEAGNLPAYLYTNGAIKWVRPQSEMELGRRKLLLKPN
jgi:hypothetical protein